MNSEKRDELPGAAEPQTESLPRRTFLQSVGVAGIGAGLFTSEAEAAPLAETVGPRAEHRCRFRCGCDGHCVRWPLRIGCRHILVKRNDMVMLLQIGELFRESLIMDMETFGIMSQRSRTLRYAVIAENADSVSIEPGDDPSYTRNMEQGKEKFFHSSIGWEPASTCNRQERLSK